MKKLLLIPVLSLVLTPSLFAATPELTVDQNVNTKTEIYKYKLFSQYSLGTGTAYTYSDSGGTNTTTGWISVSGIKDKTIGYAITNTDAGTYTIRVQGRVGTTSANAIFSISDTVFNGTTTGSIMVTEALDEMRVGINKTGTNTGTVDLWESLYTYR